MNLLDIFNLTEDQKRRFNEIKNKSENVLGRKLITLRVKKGLTQADTAEIVGLSRDVYIKMESGTCNLSIDEYRRALEKLENTLFFQEKSTIVKI